MLRDEYVIYQANMIWIYLLTRVKYPNDDHDNEWLYTTISTCPQGCKKGDTYQELDIWQCKSNQTGKEWTGRQHSCLYVNGRVNMCTKNDKVDVVDDAWADKVMEHLCRINVGSLLTMSQGIFSVIFTCCAHKRVFCQTGCTPYFHSSTVSRVLWAAMMIQIHWYIRKHCWYHGTPFVKGQNMMQIAKSGLVALSCWRCSIACNTGILNKVFWSKAQWRVVRLL